MNDRKYFLISLIVLAIAVSIYAVKTIKKNVKKDEEQYHETKLIVNINTADENELMLIPGIGEKSAQNIIEYRNKCGGFDSITDIKNVNGIKEKKYESMKEYICTE